MIRLSKLTDYAIVVMSEMGRRPDATHTVAQLADRTGVPAPTVAKLMKSLTPAGLMRSQRGASGGYVLALAPAEITVADIVTALDGPIALTACVDGADESCGVETLCPMRGGWEKINSAIRAALESVTLADMMAPVWAPPESEAPFAVTA
jgi:FeS assembly SUF system regulator